jgi:POT family proton-dependent oligopeptide transporter
VGQLYPAGDKRVDSAFTIFYMGINLGAFIAPLLCGYLGDTGNPEDFRWGFLAACLGMILSIILFVTLKNKYIVTPEGEQIGVAPNSAREANSSESAPVDTKSLLIWGGVFLATLLGFKFYGEMDWVGSFIFSLTIAAPGYIIGDSSLSTIERQRIWVIYVAAFFVIFFWAAFEQAGASLTYFAEEQTNRDIMGTTVPTSYFQSINAVAIVIFAPIFVWIWGWLGKRNMEPASPFKQSLGLFLLALGYLVIALGVKGLEPGVKVSMMWLVSLYTIHTFGELCLSPIGLSMVNKLAPVKFASLLMGVWFLSTAAANKFAGTLSALYPEPVVSVQALESMQADMASKGNTVALLPESFNAEEAAAIDGQKVIPLEKVNLSGIEDEAIKAETKLAVEKNLIDNPKTFLGFTILTLYDFFMLFVFMAGASAVFLFILSKRLLVMMNGVR